MNNPTKHTPSTPSEEKGIVSGSLKFERSKKSEPYESLFFRRSQDPSPNSGSVYSQSRTKTRLQSTRIKPRVECIYYYLYQTQKNYQQILRQYIYNLKSIIAELKLAQLYQIDESKVKKLIEYVEYLKGVRVKLYKENYKLKLENDFLNRANFQLKLYNDRLRKKWEKIGTGCKDVKIASRKYTLLGEMKIDRKYTLLSENASKNYLFANDSCTIPEHLLLGYNLAEIRSSRNKLDLNYSKYKSDPYTIRGMKTSREDLSTLSRVKSYSILNSLESHSSRRKISYKRNLYTQMEKDKDQKGLYK